MKGETSPTTNSLPTSRHLIGRERQVAVLAHALDEVASGRGGFLLLVGDAGMGKTSLCGQIMREAAHRKFAVLTGSAWEAVDAPPFWPWIQVLRQLEGPAGSNRLAEHDQRFELFDSVASALIESSTRAPMVIVLEDLHAADESTLVLLHFVHRSVAASPILLIGTCDQSEANASGPRARLLSDLTREADVLHLGRLDEVAVARICEHVAGEPLSDSLARSIYEASEGNPLFIVEAVGVLTAKSDIHRPDYSTGFRVPEGLKGMIRRRLDALTEEGLAILSIASVLGRQFDVSTLQEIADVELDPLLDLIDRAVEAGVIEVTGALGRYAFTHIMVRETLYEDLTSARRMRLHRMVAEVLERAYENDLEPRLAELAHHWFKAAQAGDSAKAIDYASRAAVVAEERGAYEEAVRLYRRAIKVAEGTRQARKTIEVLRAAVAAAGKRTGTASAGTVGASPTRFASEGDYWTIAYEGVETRLRDAKGLRYIHVLLRNPGREIHTLELVQLCAGTTAPNASPARERGLGTTSGDAGAVLDATAKAHYKARLEDLREEVEEAEAFGDPERASRAREEIEALTRELAGAFGLGGRDRKAVSNAERARVSVQKAIRESLRRIDEAAPSLGEHLAATIRTGKFCRYEPDPRAPIGWQL